MLRKEQKECTLWRNKYKKLSYLPYNLGMELGECTRDALGVIVLDYEYSLTSKYI